MSWLTAAAAKAAITTVRFVGREMALIAPGLPRIVLPAGSARLAGYDRLFHQAFWTASPVGQPPYRDDERPVPRLLPSADPVASIVVSSWNGLGYTLRCLASIGDDDTSVPYEVIVVDDASTEPGVQQALGAIDGIRLECLPANVGYLDATNRGAALARGQYVVLLNNDVQVSRGWLDALVSRARTDPSIGVVGARLLYPDGRLQEAGSIIWRDGSGWNYGRGESPNDSEYRFVREVDYCSAACVLVRRSDGPLFDDRFSPAYFEDTDLCFSTRSRGGRVVYEPRATVFHHEGVSHGTDLASGLKAFQVRNRQTFIDKWRPALEEQLPADARSVPLARDRRRLAHVLVIDERIPTPDIDSGSVRMFALLEALTDLGHPVHFVPADRKCVARYAESLEEIGVEVLESTSSTRRFLRTLGPHVALCIVSRPRVADAYLRIIRRTCPGAILAYDMVDFHAVRDQRMAKLGAPHATVRQMRRTERIEARALAAADAVIAITNEERHLAVERVHGKPVFVFPNVHDVEARPQPPMRGRKDLLFVGNFLHTPNVEAAAYIIDELAPLLAKRLPGVVTQVVGRGAPDHLVARAPANVLFRGWLPDLGDAYAAARVAVAPLRAGAGMKGKVGEAMAQGVPVVTTSIGAEGFEADDGRHLLIANDPAAFVNAIERLMNDDDLWGAMASAANDLVVEQFSQASAQARLLDMLTTLEVH